MAFNSFQYALLLSFVVAVYWMVPPRERRWLLLGASYVFYASWDVRFVALLFASTTVGFLTGRALSATDDHRRRVRIAAAAIVFNVCVLGFFKYANFFLDSTQELLDRLGTTTPEWSLRVVLPVGVSFFTFQMISYIVDVYRREAEATDSYLTFLLFGSFFPHLLAGPICRARRLIPQLGCDRRGPDPVQIAEGLELILIGLFMKVAIGDALNQVTTPIFATFTDPAAADPSWLTLWVATFGSVIQFVLDFAGYSNIARGSSKLVGIELPYNFRQPLTRSKDFQDFWRREHMTLMAWFRDYVYRPLHRRDRGPWYDHSVLLFLFALSGLWHAASWLWVTWGLLVGAFLVVELEVKRRRAARERAARKAARSAGRPEVPPSVDPDLAAMSDPDAASLGEADHVAPEAGPRLLGDADLVSPAARGERVIVPATAPAPARRPRRSVVRGFVPATVYVFVLIALQIAWIRTGAIGSALDLYGSLFSPGGGGVDVDMFFLFLYGVAAMLLVDNRQVRMEAVEGTPDPVTIPRAVGFGAMVVLIIVFSGAPPQPFVYFQF